MIMSIDGKSFFDKIQQPFLIKTEQRKKNALNELGLEGDFLDLTKYTYKKTCSYHHI